jgi:hypothetical protein
MRKTFLVILAGFILGVVATLVSEYVCFRLRVRGPMRVFPPVQVIAPRGISLDAGKMIRATTRNGTTLINFTSYGDAESESTYRWRFRSRSGFETSGTGSVKEGKNHKGPPVVTGNLKLGWSWGSKTNCWLYYFEDDVEVKVLPDTTFNTEDLN